MVFEAAGPPFTVEGADLDVISRMTTGVESSDLAVSLVDLNQMYRLATSVSLRELFDADSAGEVLLPCCRDHLQLLQGERRLNGVQYEATFEDAYGGEQHRQVAIQRVPGFDHLALVVVSREPGAFMAKPSSQLPPAAGMESVVLGTIGPDLRIIFLSAEIEGLLGFESHEVTGRLFFELFDGTAVPFLMMALGWALEGGRPLAVQALASKRNGSRCLVDVTLLPGSSAAGADDETVFLLRIADRSESSDVAPRRALEQLVWRIATEIEAAALAPQVGQLSAFLDAASIGSLSSRQIEVLTRLVSGERTPVIAREMFISESTVRNHLSTIFSKFGVHSQSELIEKLQAQRTRSTG